MSLKYLMIISTHCADLVSLSISALKYLSMLLVTISMLVSLSISALTTYLSTWSVLMSVLISLSISALTTDLSMLLVLMMPVLMSKHLLAVRFYRVNEKNRGFHLIPKTLFRWMNPKVIGSYTFKPPYSQ